MRFRLRMENIGKRAQYAFRWLSAFIPFVFALCIRNLQLRTAIDEPLSDCYCYFSKSLPRSNIIDRGNMFSSYSESIINFMRRWFVLSINFSKRFYKTYLSLIERLPYLWVDVDWYFTTVFCCCWLSERQRQNSLKTIRTWLWLYISFNRR